MSRRSHPRSTVSGSHLQRRPLSAERIVTAALHLIDEEGLEQLSMRRLGDALGVQGMAVYRHVSGKDEILDGVRRLLVQEFSERMAAAGPFTGWRDHLRTFGVAYREVGRTHPHAFPLVASGAERAWAYGRAIAGAALASLIDNGFPEAIAIDAERTIIRYVIGFSLVDVAGQRTPPPDLDEIDRSDPALARLVRSIEPPNANEDLFQFGLDLILDGLAARLTAGAPAP